MYETYFNTLNTLDENSHLRDIKDFELKDEKFITFRGKKLLNLSSNNYLGFADNRAITEEFLAQCKSDYSFGSASARLLTGTLPVYKELESTISTLFNTENTLLI